MNCFLELPIVPWDQNVQFDWFKALQSVIFFLPAYIANATPTISGGGTPIDLNHTFLDGRPVFGKHKTVRGFFSGLVAGTLVGLLQNAPVTGFILSLGALLGDLLGAFIKRRLNIQPGKPFPVLDQLDFVAGALLPISLSSPVSLEVVFYLVVLTPVFHLTTNAIAYLLKVKPVPW